MAAGMDDLKKFYFCDYIKIPTASTRITYGSASLNESNN